MKLTLILPAIFIVVTSHAIVDMRNANFGDNWIDLQIPGSGYDLKVERTYNSRSLFNGVFGFGWCSDLETKLDITPEGNLIITECGAGQKVVFYPKNFSPKDIEQTITKILNNLKKDPKITAKTNFDELKKELANNDQLRAEYAARLGIAQPVSPGTVFYANGREVEKFVFEKTYYNRTLPDGTSQRFDINGNITHMYDRNGNFLTFKKDKGIIQEVADNNGRKLQFKYYNNRKVAAILGPNNTKAEYKYKNLDDLVWMKDQRGDAYTYEYDNYHNLTKITFPDKKTKELTYDVQRDWVLSFKNRDNCIENYKYGDSKDDPRNHYWSLVEKKCGDKVVNKSKYEFWHKVRQDGRRYLARVFSDVNGEITDITYHEVFGKPTYLQRNSQKTKISYYDNGLVKTKTANNVEMSFAYDKTTNKVSSVTTITQEKNGKKIKRVTAFKYDNKGNLADAENSDGQKVKLTYDHMGRIASITDQAKKLVQIKYEEKFGKPSYVTRPGVGTIKVIYKADGSIDKVESKDGPTVAVQVASTFNNLLDIIAPATNEIGF